MIFHIIRNPSLMNQWRNVWQQKISTCIVFATEFQSLVDIFLILITCSLNNVSILKQEFKNWSLFAVKGLNTKSTMAWMRSSVNFALKFLADISSDQKSQPDEQERECLATEGKYLICICQRISISSRYFLNSHYLPT